MTTIQTVYYLTGGTIALIQHKDISVDDRLLIDGKIWVVRYVTTYGVWLWNEGLAINWPIPTEDFNVLDATLAETDDEEEQIPMSKAEERAFDNEYLK